MKKVIVGIALAVVLLVGIRVALSLHSSGDDQAAIQTALQESIRASKEGRPGGVMDKLSDQLKFNGEDQGVNMRQVANFIRNQKPDVEVTNQQAIVTGDEARITSPVDLAVNFLGQQRTVHLKDVVLIFRREDARQWLVLPSKQWRLAEVRAPNVSAADFMP